MLVGTIFENTNIPMRTWFKVIYLMLTSKKSIAALQVHRMFGFGSYSTAHYMCHRIRAGLAKPGTQWQARKALLRGPSVFLNANLRRGSDAAMDRIDDKRLARG